jgi:RNA polymerase sigma factor (sigma-70 family)
MGDKDVPTDYNQGGKQLLDSIQAGAPDWKAIYELNRGPMSRTAARFIRGENSAVAGVQVADIVQQAMLEMITSGLPREMRSLDGLRSWMVKVAWRRAYDACNGPKSRVNPLPPEGSPYELADDDGAEEEAVELELLYEKAVAGLEKLNESERLVISEHVIRGRTQADVARDLGVTDARVRQLRDSGIRKLARTVGPLHR